ncbi:MAG: flippase-like domain-containing protein [Bacilli bacterium]|nr:flippase-like domain-containing protein [Bacilli bacterium]
MNKKNTKSIIIILLIMAIVLYFIMKDDFQDIVDNLLSANKWLIMVGVILIIGYWLLRALALYIVVKKYKKDIKYSKMLHQILITQFFNGITPFATGGEPMQVYMLNKSGVKVAQATNIIVQEFIMYQAALVLVGLIALILNFAFDICNVNPVLFNLILIGFIINIGVGVISLFISFSKKFSTFLVNFCLKVGIKLRLIKDKEKTTEIWNEKVKEYNASGTMLKENKKLFFTCVFVNLLALIIFYLIPFFVFMSMGQNVGVMEVIVLSAFILLVGNFVPLPGGSGGIEGAFLEFFKTIIPFVDTREAILKSALIIWRVITYYFGIVIGGVALGFFKGDEKK